MKIKIDIIKPYKKWNLNKAISKQYITEILGHILSYYPNLQNIVLVELSILLTNDEEIKNLNLIHRKKDTATNILSFPDTDELLYKKLDTQYNLYLGDLALSYDRIYAESVEKNISFYNHFTHLLIHGILHLLGYDHVDEEEAQEMESLEELFLSHFNISTPY